MSIPVSLGPRPHDGASAGAADQASMPMGIPRPRARRDVASPLWILMSVFAAVATIAVRGVLPQPLWTMVHVITLGVLTNAILHWTWFFARALLRLDPAHQGPRRHTVLRLIAVNLAFLVLVAGMWLGMMSLIVTGTMVYAAIVAWHGLALVVAARTLLASRFAVVIRYYIAAAAFFVLAAFFAALVATTMFVVDLPAWFVEARDALTIAHMSAGVFGWVGLTIAGTLVTLWPTMLRARMAPWAVDAAMWALPLWCVGVLACVCGALIPAGQVAARVVGVGAGLIAAAAVVGVGLGVAQALRMPRPSSRAADPSSLKMAASHTPGPTLVEYPALGAACALVWLVAGMIAFALTALFSQDVTALRGQSLTWLPLIGAGGLIQLMLAALSYLTPVASGGGPKAVKASVRVVNAFATLRISIRHLALALLAVQSVAAHLPSTIWGEGVAASPVSALVQARLSTGLWLVVVFSVVVDLAVLAFAIFVQRRVALALMRSRRPQPRDAHASGTTPQDEATALASTAPLERAASQPPTSLPMIPTEESPHER